MDLGREMDWGRVKEEFGDRNGFGEGDVVWGREMGWGERIVGEQEGLVQGEWLGEEDGMEMGWGVRCVW